MSLIYFLEETNYGRLSQDKVITLANKNPEFCSQWLIHSIRSNAGAFELAVAIAFSDQWNISCLNTIERYLEKFVSDIALDIPLINDAINKAKSVVDDINEKRVKGILAKLHLVAHNPVTPITLSQYAKLTPSKIPDGILNEVMGWAKPYLKDVTLFGKQGSASKDESIRNNSHYPTPLPNSSIELALLERVISGCANMPIEFAEPSVILRYLPNQYYKWHYDHIYPHNQGIQQQIDQFGQRVKTGIFYLNDNFVGGETQFKKPPISVTPKQGNVLTFDNTSKDKQRLVESLHRGAELVEGEKWIITLWFRDKPFWLRNGLF